MWRRCGGEHYAVTVCVSETISTHVKKNAHSLLSVRVGYQPGGVDVWATWRGTL